MQEIWQFLINFKTGYSNYIGLLLAYLIAALLLSVFILLYRQNKENSSNIQKAKRTFEKRDQELLLCEDKTQKQLIIQIINFAVNMQEAMTPKARLRADILFWIGILLLVLSIAFPIIATIIYYEIDTISHETAQALIYLKKGANESQKELDIPLSRDWHILLGGVTFGFLCLAAARGIFAQQSNELKAFNEFGQRARYFERLNSVAQIIISSCDHLSNESISYLRDKLLLDPSTITDEESRKLEDEVSLISEVLKAIQQSHKPPTG